MQSRRFRPGAPASGRLWAMDFPVWVKKEIQNLPPDFTGQVLVEVWEGNPTRVDTLTRTKPPKDVKIGGTN